MLAVRDDGRERAHGDRDRLQLPDQAIREKSVRAIRLVVMIALVAVVGTACGSSSKSATSGSTSTPTARGSFNGAGLCDLLGNATAGSGGTGIATVTPAELNKLYQNIGPALDQARSAAPSAMKSDFDTFITAYRPFLNAINTPGYDVRKVPRSALLRLASPQVKAASTRIAQYMRQVCKITTTPTT